MFPVSSCAQNSWKKPDLTWKRLLACSCVRLLQLQNVGSGNHQSHGRQTYFGEKHTTRSYSVQVGNILWIAFTNTHICFWQPALWISPKSGINNRNEFQHLATVKREGRSKKQSTHYLQQCIQKYGKAHWARSSIAFRRRRPPNCQQVRKHSISFDSLPMSDVSPHILFRTFCVDSQSIL